MARTEILTRNTRELERLKTVQAVADDGLKPMVAAARMGLTTRQIQRLVNRYRIEGAGGLVSRGAPIHVKRRPDPPCRPAILNSTS